MDRQNITAQLADVAANLKLDSRLTGGFRIVAYTKLLMKIVQVLAQDNSGVIFFFLWEFGLLCPFCCLFNFNIVDMFPYIHLHNLLAPFFHTQANILSQLHPREYYWLSNLSSQWSLLFSIFSLLFGVEFSLNNTFWEMMGNVLLWKVCRITKI